MDGGGERQGMGKTEREREERNVEEEGGGHGGLKREIKKRNEKKKKKGILRAGQSRAEPSRDMVV